MYTASWSVWPVQKLFVSFFALTLLVLPFGALALAVSPFVDVSADYEFIQALDSLKSRQVISGYPDQTFQPEKGISRAEFLKITLGSSSAKPENPQDIQFSDVSPQDWFYDVVKSAKNLGVVQGYADGSFKPHQGVSRVEALKMLYMAYKIVPEFKDLNFPKDIESSAWFYNYVGAAREKWIVSDYDDGLFRPHQALTRGMAAEIVYRFHEVYTRNLAEFDVTPEWNEFKSPVGNFSLKMPRNWTVIPEATRTVFWKEDPAVLQNDYAFITPLSAKLIVRHPVGVTAETPEAYFKEVRSLSETIFGAANVHFTEMAFSYPALGVFVESKGVENWYFYLGSKKALIVYAEAGQSSLNYKLRETTRAMVRTLQVFAAESGGLANADQKAMEQILNQIHANTLIEGKGKETLELMKDAVIFETDPIGVGTGIVDYYFSANMNISLKYERASDTVLSMRAGKTSRF